MISRAFLRTSDTVSRSAKVGRILVPQEYNLERFFANISNPHCSWTTNTTACEWKGIQCDTNGNVNRIELGVSPIISFLTGEKDEYYGTFTWRYMPDTTLHLAVGELKGISGVLSIADLAPSLYSIFITNCALYGSVDLTVLPQKLTCLSLDGNRFSGALDLTSLPQELIILCLQRNCFEGEVNLSKLPATLTTLDLRSNYIHIASVIPSFVFL